MRAGSGAVLLVGFALVVMLLSIVSTINQPSIVMKQDPSQDFADIASSVREIAKLCKNSPPGQEDKCINYIENTINNTVNISLKTKGLILSDPVIIQYFNVVYYYYKLYSYDKSSFFEFLFDVPISNNQQSTNQQPSNNQQSTTNIPMVVCNRVSGGRATCFIRNPCSNVITIRLEAPAKIHVIFPGQGEKSIPNKNGIAEFSLDPMGTDVCPGISLGRRILAISDVYADSGYLTLTVESGCCTDQCSFKVPLSCDSEECSLNYGQFLQLLRGISECKGSG